MKQMEHGQNVKTIFPNVYSKTSFVEIHVSQYVVKTKLLAA